MPEKSLDNASALPSFLDPTATRAATAAIARSPSPGLRVLLRELSVFISDSFLYRGMFEIWEYMPNDNEDIGQP